MIEDFIRRAVERAIHQAEHPKGASLHSGKAVIEASYLRRMLAMLDAAPTPPVQQDEPDFWLRQTSSDRNPPHGWAVHYTKKDGDVPVFLKAQAPALRLPEPMTEDDINLAARAELADLLDHIYEYGTMSEGVMSLAVAFACAIEAETLRRVKEANKWTS